MIPNTLGMHEQELVKQIASQWKLTPATFMQKVSKGQWIAAPWLQYISLKVATAVARGGARIIISAPPRHGKSELISIGTSAWFLENFPNRNVILTGYGAELMEGYGRRVRDMFEDSGDLLNAHIRPDASRVNAFLTSTNGYMFSVGLGGAITGRGAHLLLVDDYIKEIKEALSQTHRDYLWNWWVTTARTRLEPGASVIIIATRWHSDDLIGRLIAAFPGRWQNYVFPAICEEEQDIIGRHQGEALFPERFPIEDLQALHTELGSTFFQALYQQRPVDEAKKLSDGAWLTKTEVLPQLARIKKARIWDLAATEGGGDYTVGAHCGWDRMNEKFYILNIIRRQISPHQVEDLVRQTAISDGFDTEVCIEQEPGASGKALVEHYQRTVLPEYTVTPIPVVTNKVVRAQPLLAGAEAGKVILIAAGWNEAYIREFDTFPGEFDDQIDTTAAGYTRLTGKKIFSATWGRNIPTAARKNVTSKAILTVGRKGVTWGPRSSSYA
jgi:predicted phage terminase large subunit-like protein